jgi:hypothetical protein
MRGDGEKRLVLVLDEKNSETAKWFEELSRQFQVKRVVSVIGSHRSGHEAAPAAAVLCINSPEVRAGALISLIRGQPGLETCPIFMLAPAPIEALAQALKALPSVEVVDLARASWTLRTRVGGSGSFGGGSEAPGETKRNSGAMNVVGGPSVSPHERLQQRFLVHSAERGQRALSLCDEMRTHTLSVERRRALLVEVKDLLNMMKGEATMLRLRAIADLLMTAETIVARLDDSQRVLVPRGVLGLFSDLATLGASGASLASFDVDLHRQRLGAADDEERPRSSRS